MPLSNFYGELAAIGGAVCFGLGNVIIKSQGGKINPIAINAIRLTFSAIFYFLLIVFLGDLRATFTIDMQSALFMILGSLLAIVVGDAVFYFSQQLIGLSEAYPIAVSYPLLTYIFGMILGYEFFELVRIQGVALVLVGVYLVSISTTNPNDRFYSKNNEAIYIGLKNPLDVDVLNPDEVKLETESMNLSKKNRRKAPILGISGAILTAFCWTIGTILLDQGLNSGISGISANALRIIFIAPIAMGIFLVGNRGKMKSKFTWKGFFFVLVAGILGNTFGGLLYVFALTYTDASSTAAISAAAPLIATPLSVIFLKEKVSILLIFGTLITIFGIWLIII